MSHLSYLDLSLLLSILYCGAVSAQPCETHELFIGHNDRITDLGVAHLDVADINNDGYPDALVGDSNSSSIALYFGDTQPRLVSDISLHMGSAANTLCAADVNKDGHIDLVAGTSSRHVNVRLGDGSGEFGPVISSSASAEPRTLFITDLNGDTTPDAVIMGEHPYPVSYLLGNGDGTFQSAVEINRTDYWSALFHGDLNNDGSPDVIFTDRAISSVVVVLSRSSRSVSDPIRIQLDHEVNHVVTQDMDDDGYSDLVIFGDDQFTVVKNHDGHAYSLMGSGNLNSEAAVISSADLNDDGHNDLVVLDQINGHQVDIYLFQPEQYYEYSDRYTVGTGIESITIVDYDLDGILDILTAGRTLTLTKGTGGGRMESHRVIATGTNPRMSKLIDANSDSIMDLVTVNEGDFSVSIYIGGDNAEFSEPTTLLTRSAPFDVAVGDINSDGLDDFVVGHNVSLSITTFINQGNGNFAEGVVIPTGDTTQSVRLADLDHDGNPELISAHEEADYISVWDGLGNGRFGLRTNYEFAADPSSIEVADVNNDGNNDVLVVGMHSNELNVFYGTGHDFLPIQETFRITNSIISSLTIADFDTDGWLDVAIASSDDSLFRREKITILMNDGAGGFGGPELISSELECFDIESADFNGDEILDLCVLSSDARSFLIHTGNGDGTFQDPITFLVGFSPRSIITYDFNLDGRVDVLTTNRGSRNMNLHLNRCTTFGSCAVDMNSDGSLNFFDVSAFLVLYIDSNPAADFNDDAQLNFFDVSAFLTAFNAGCP